jgi:DNA-binding response OmpR family regulator
MSTPKKRVLVVDDEPGICDGVEIVLSRAGFEVAKALSGEEALRQIEAKPFDVVLLDLIMPGMDGAETCARIKAMRPDTHILAISGSPTGERLEKLVRTEGVKAYLYKPFGKVELLAGVEKALRND